MKFWIGIIISFFVIAFKSPMVAQSVEDRKAIRKQEKADIDSLFLVYSIPINVSYTYNFTQPAIADSLITLIHRRKYEYLDSSASAELYRAKIAELFPKPGDIEGMREFTAKTQSDKNYYADKFQSSDPFAQQIQLSFLKKDSGINYINVKRSNMPNVKKYRDWIFTYSDSEPPNQVAIRILDSLANTRR